MSQYRHSWKVQSGMSKLNSHIFAATLAILIAAGPVQAQEPAPPKAMPEQAEEAIREGVQTILRALGVFVESIPQYEMPEVLENGDIIIRRKKPKDRKKAPDNTDST